ncbi:hypothetical protein MMC17_008168 [Xylographa soralifera]|nr:hypothetical protein [Xylographa soralifera]
MSHPSLPHELPASTHRTPPPPPSLPFAASTPPPPPPKPSSHEASRMSTPQNGPPVPPPPTHSTHDTRPQGTRYAPVAEGLSSGETPPPGIDHGWLPEMVKEQSSAALLSLALASTPTRLIVSANRLPNRTLTLTTLLSSPPLLRALPLSPPPHPSYTSTLPPLTHLLQTNLALSHSLLTLQTTLSHLRTRTATQLLHVHSLERQWRRQQSALDDALAPFAPQALHQRLGASIAEQEAYLAAVEESFLEGEGRAGERETGEMVKRWREGRRVLEVRRERRERWEEGRVGGWR